MDALTIPGIHCFSQLVYLDAPPGMSPNETVTVGELAAYYLDNPAGRQRLLARFEKIPREYGEWLRFLREGVAPYSSWKIADIFDDNQPYQSGLYGCCYRSPAGARVVSFRGSELLGNPRHRNDYETNLALAYQSPTPQQAKVDAYWARFGANYTDDAPLAVTGHSLGGNLAVYGAIMAPEAIRRRLTACLSFNAPGFPAGFRKKNKPVISELGSRLVLYQNKHDPVSSLLENVVPPVVVASKFQPSREDAPGVADILYPHSNFMFLTGDAGNFILDEAGEKCRFCKMVHLLSDLLMLLPRETREALSHTVLDVLYGSGKAAIPEVLGRFLTQEAHQAEPGENSISALARAADMAAKEGYSVPELFRLVAGGEPVFTALVHTLLILLECFL